MLASIAILPSSKSQGVSPAASRTSAATSASRESLQASSPSRRIAASTRTAERPRAAVWLGPATLNTAASVYGKTGLL